ncbi:MAG TPA: MFS transporter [Anaerolineaceae bacterium]
MDQKTTLRETFSLVFPLYVPSFLFTFSHSLLTPILPLYAKSFEVPYTLIGVVLAGESIGMLIGDLPAGMLLRRLGQKGSMLIGIALTAISTASLFWVTTIWAVVFFRMLAGLGGSLFAVSRHYFLVEMVPVHNRGRIISLYGGVFRLGRFVGPLAGGAIAAAFGLRSSFLFFGGICLLALVIITFVLPHVEVRKESESVGFRASLKQFLEMFRSMYKVLATCGLGALFLQVVRSGPATVIPLYAADILELDVRAISLIVGISAGLEMLVFLPAGLMMDRLGRKYAVITSCITLGLGIALVPLTTGFGGLLMAGMLAGLGGGFGSGALLTLGSDLAPEKGRGEFLGSWTLIGDIGSTSGPLIVGSLADFMPLPPTAWFIAASGGIAGTIFLLFVPETLKARAK